MGVSKKKLKSIAFDLDTKALQEHYTDGDWHNAYSDIGDFLEKQGFMRMQGSVYDSTSKFSDAGLGKIIEKMSKELTWLAECVKSIRGYDQPIMIDYTQQLKDGFTQDLSLDNKQELAVKRMKEKIDNLAKSGKLQKQDSKKNNKDMDR